jgi:hypothetical protein
MAKDRERNKEEFFDSIHCRRYRVCELKPAKVKGAVLNLLADE